MSVRIGVDLGGTHIKAALFDAAGRLLASETKALAHWTPLRLHHAAVDVGARAALLEPQPIRPGSSGRVQLVLERPIAAAAGDRFVVRDTAGTRSVGGGRFIDLRPPQRRRRMPQRLAQLEALSREDAREALVSALERWPFFVDVTAFARDRALSAHETHALLATVPHARIAVDDATVALSPDTWSRIGRSAREALEAAHRAHPERPGLSAVRLAAAIEPRLPARVSARTIVAHWCSRS